MRTISIRRVVALTTLVAIVAAFAVAVAFAESLTFGSVQRVNVAYDGGLANGEGLLGLACSADGRYVAFASSASNILEGDTNGRYDIFYRDMVSQETTLVNQTMSGGFGSQGAVNYVEMTPDGRYVLFVSHDSDVVPGDSNGYSDIFVRDMISRETTCVSTASDGTFGDYYPSGDGSLSDDGRYAVYSSSASNLYPGDANSKQDCILKDLQSGEATNVSYTYNGGQGNNHSFYPVISGDGSKVAFISYSTDMVPGDVSSLGNLFIRDIATGDIERVDATTSGGESTKEVDLIYCDVDYTGRNVVFGSRQTDIVSTPAGVASQVFLRDTVSDETTVVSRAIGGEAADNQNNSPRISSDGRWVSFMGQATNLVEDDTNNMGDLFLRDMQSDGVERLSLNVHGEQLDRWTYDQALGANATAVAFNTSATNIFDEYTSPALGHIYLRVFRTDDAEPPTVKVEIKDSRKGSASISLSATDGQTGTGVDFIEWRLDSNATQTVSGDLATLAAGAGRHTLRFRAQDVAGNSSGTETKAFVVAAPTTTVLTSTSKTLSKYGQSYQLKGILRAGGVGLGGKQIRIQASSSGGAFVTVPVVVTSLPDGSFSVNVVPRDKTTYRAYYAGDGSTYVASPYSGSVVVTPCTYVGTPKAPKTMRKSKYYTVYGYFKPRHPSGTYPVRIYKWKKTSSGRWKSYGYVKARVSNYSDYSKYAKKIRLTSRGKWRLRAYAPADSGHAAAWSSGYDYVTVK